MNKSLKIIIIVIILGALVASGLYISKTNSIQGFISRQNVNRFEKEINAMEAEETDTEPINIEVQKTETTTTYNSGTCSHESVKIFEGYTKYENKNSISQYEMDAQKRISYENLESIINNGCIIRAVVIDSHSYGKSNTAYDCKRVLIGKKQFSCIHQEYQDWEKKISNKGFLLYFTNQEDTLFTYVNDIDIEELTLSLFARK